MNLNAVACKTRLSRLTLSHRVGDPPPTSLVVEALFRALMRSRVSDLGHVAEQAYLGGSLEKQGPHLQAPPFLHFLRSSKSRRSAAFRIRQAKGELHRWRRKLRGNSTGRASPRCSESVKLRGNSTGRVVPRRSESVKLRGNSTGRVHRSRRSAVFRIRQAKGKLHRSHRC